MAYRILSIIQSLFIAVCGVSVLDLGLAFDDILSDSTSGFGFNELLFGNSESLWWSFMSFWAYCFFAVALLQIIKAIAYKKD